MVIKLRELPYFLLYSMPTCCLTKKTRQSNSFGQRSYMPTQWIYQLSPETQLEDIVEAQKQPVRGFLHRIVNDTQNKMK